MSPNISAVRSDLPAVLTSTYLNTGSYGPLSRAAATAIEKESRQQLEIGRLASMGESGQSIGASLRAGFARVFGCESDEVALTHHTTDGMNIATWGVQYRPGDEIVTNSWEHPGGLLPVYAVARRFDPEALDTAIATIPPPNLDDIRTQLGLLSPTWADSHRQPLLRPTHPDDAADSVAIVQRLIGRHLDGRTPPTPGPGIPPSRDR